MENINENYREFFKEKIFELCEELYDLGLNIAEYWHKGDDTLIKNFSEQKLKIYNDIIWRLQDYYSFKYDDPITDLNFNDYNNIK